MANSYTSNAGESMMAIRQICHFCSSIDPESSLADMACAKRQTGQSWLIPALWTCNPVDSLDANTNYTFELHTRRLGRPRNRWTFKTYEQLVIKNTNATSYTFKHFPRY